MGPEDVAGRVTHFVAISETVRGRIARCYRRDSRVIQPPVDAAFYTPDPDGRPRDDGYLVVSALVPYKRIDQAVSACTESGRRLTIIGEGPERARLEAMAGPIGPVPGLAARRRDPRSHYRSCRALLFPGEEDFGIVPIEALACGAPVIALGAAAPPRPLTTPSAGPIPSPRRTPSARRSTPGSVQGCPHDPILARRRAEAFALPLFRQRLLGFLAEVMASSEWSPGAAGTAPGYETGLTFPIVANRHLLDFPMIANRDFPE